MKRCTKCGVLKPYDCFYKHSYTKDKLGSWCKNCMNVHRGVRDLHKARIRSRKYYYLHRDEILAKAKLNPRTKYFKNYRSINKDKIANYYKDWYENNKEWYNKKRRVGS